MAGAGDDRRSQKRSALTNPAIALGTNLMAGMLFFSGIGYYLDHRGGKNGQVWTITGMFLGLGWCGYEVWKLVRQSNQDAAKRTDDRDDSSD